MSKTGPVEGRNLHFFSFEYHTMIASTLMIGRFSIYRTHTLRPYTHNDKPTKVYAGGSGSILTYDVQRFLNVSIV